MKMKALSIRQPWAWAILHAGKDIENREWATRFRGRVLLHVGRKFETDDALFIERTAGIELPARSSFELGGIVGSVEIVDCVSKSDSSWFFGKYGFVLRNPRTLPFLPMKGQLGFFDVDIPDGDAACP